MNDIDNYQIEPEIVSRGCALPQFDIEVDAQADGTLVLLYRDANGKLQPLPDKYDLYIGDLEEVEVRLQFPSPSGVVVVSVGGESRTYEADRKGLAVIPLAPALDYDLEVSCSGQRQKSSRPPTAKVIVRPHSECPPETGFPLVCDPG